MAIYVLEGIPWGFTYPGVQYWKDKKIHVWQGSVLPHALQPYRTTDFSYARWREDEMNSSVSPTSRGKTVFTPHPHQKDGAKFIASSYQQGHSGVLVADHTGTGKGLSASTPIPTAHGWKTMEQVQVGDTLFSVDGSTTTVLEKHTSHAEKHYKITFSDGSIIYADGDHRWLTETHRERMQPLSPIYEDITDLEESETRELVSYLEQAQQERVPVTLGNCLDAIDHRNHHVIRELLQTVEAYAIDHAIQTKAYHPQEVLEQVHHRILHSSQKASSQVRNTEQIRRTLNTSPDKKQHNHSIEATYAVLRASEDSTEHFTTQERESLREHYSQGYRADRGALENHIFSSAEERAALLSGIIDLSGHIEDTGHTEDSRIVLTGLSDDISGAVWSLICSLGWVMDERTDDGADENTMSFVVTGGYTQNSYSVENITALIRSSSQSALRRYIVAVDEVPQTEAHYCISVDSSDHLYLCGRSYIPTHNTLTSLAGVTAIARSERKSDQKNERATLLIVSPKGVMPVWRQTLHNFPISTQFLRPLIMSYHQLNKLLQAPSNARTAKKARTKNRATARQGKPTVDWDYIIFDEAHYLKNFPSSTMSVSASNLAQLEKKYEKGRSPFVIYSTATPGSSPLNFALMSQMVAPLVAANHRKQLSSAVTPMQWGEFLKNYGFDVKESKIKGSWNWGSTPWYGKNSDDPTERAKYQAGVHRAKSNQRRDAIEIGKALKRKDAPFIMRRPQDLADWPEQQLIPLPAELTQKQLPIYQEAWNRFRQYLNLKPKGSDPKGSLVETLRYRQKSSLLRVESLVDHIVDSVNNGNQVFVSCEFSETIDKYIEALTKKDITVAEISGRNTATREEERIRFQKGEAKVVLCSVVAGISLQAEEVLPDGTKATPASRITYVHDIRQNPLDTVQLLGRCHRDGKNSLAYFPYFVETVDEKIVESFTNKQANMKLMTGGSKEDSEEIENMFRQAAARSH